LTSLSLSRRDYGCEEGHGPAQLGDSTSSVPGGTRRGAQHMNELQELERGGLAEGQTPATSAVEPGVNEAPPPVDQPEALVADNAKGSNRYAEAGCMGAQRVHQLIREGRLYEREHGLKPGRQRLRQLIQQGKLYEREHDLNRAGTGTRRPVR